MIFSTSVLIIDIKLSYFLADLKHWYFLPRSKLKVDILAQKFFWIHSHFAFENTESEVSMTIASDLGN